MSFPHNAAHVNRHERVLRSRYGHRGILERDVVRAAMGHDDEAFHRDEF